MSVGLRLSGRVAFGVVASSSLLAAVLGAATAPGRAAVQVTLTVDAKANIFAAGFPRAFDGVLPPAVIFSAGPGKVVTFTSVTGLVGTGSAPSYGPDGATGTTDISSYEGISGIVHGRKAFFLVGVFLDDSVPSEPAPPRLDFTGSDSFETLAPAIRQTFFVGDGLTGTGSGKQQQFLVPASATRLFLGMADAADFHGAPSWYWDNTGAFTATVELGGASSLLFLPAALSDGFLEKPYSQTLQVSGGTPPFQWSVSSGSLPPGLSLNSATGTIGGTPSVAGLFRFTVRVTDASQAAATVTLAIDIPEGRVCAPEPTNMGISYGDLITCQIDPVGDTDLFRFSGAPGELVLMHAVRTSGAGVGCVRLVQPDGAMSEWGCAGLILKLTQAGTHTIQVAEDCYDQTVSYALLLERLTPPSPTAIPVYFGRPLEGDVNPVGDMDAVYFRGSAGDAISAQMVRLDGAGEPAVLMVDPDGNLPLGGWVRGGSDVRLTKPGLYTLMLADNNCDQTLSYRLEVQCFGVCQGASPPVTIATASPLSEATAGIAYSYTLAATGGSPPYRWSVSAGALPAGLSLNGSSGVISGTPAAAGTFTFTVQVADSAGGSAVATFTITVMVSSPGGAPQILSLVNAASMTAGAVAPGEIVTLFGVNLGPANLTNYQLNELGQMATSLAGTQVLFDNIPAPLLYVQAGQLSAIVPYAVAGTLRAGVQVDYRGLRSNVMAALVAPSAPGIFVTDASGKGQAAALNQNYSVNSAANPAEKGSVVMVYATGEGETDPQVADGRFATPEELPKPKLPVTVRIGGLDAVVLYAGSAPPQIVGLLQVNVLVPPNAPSGSAVPVVLTVGAASSQTGVTMAVR